MNVLDDAALEMLHNLYLALWYHLSRGYRDLVQVGELQPRSVEPRAAT